MSSPWNLTLLHSPRYKVAITKQKDLEHSVGSLYNQNDVWNPAVDFSKYIEDNESIENEVRKITSQLKLNTSYLF